MNEPIQCTVVILDKEYRVACEEHTKDELLASAQYLDDKMKSLRDDIGIVGLDRLAIIAALNIANEMLQSKNQADDISRDVRQRIGALGKKITDTLGPGDELDL